MVPENTLPAEAAYDWHIAVFCHNEGERLAECIRAINSAVLSANRRALITVVLNGQTDDSLKWAELARRESPCQTEIRQHPLADKSAAINRFFYDYRVEASCYFCIDGYVVIEPQSLAVLSDALDATPEARIASGRASNGRTMARRTELGVRFGGDVSGGLYAVRPEFLNRIVAAGLRLPVGLYRGDGLLGAFARHDLDACNEPVRERAIGVGNARFAILSLSVMRPRDVARQMRRKVRQMRGLIENAAIREVTSRQGFGGLPSNADAMMRHYLVANPVPRVSLLDRPFMRLALRRLTTAPKF